MTLFNRRNFMSKRPLCLFAFLLIFGIGLLDSLGLSEKGRSEKVFAKLEEENKKVQISGYIYDLQEKNTSIYIYLKEVILLSDSKNIQLNKLLIKQKKENHTPLKIGNTVVAVGYPKAFEKERNKGGYNEKSYFMGKGIFGYMEIQEFNKIGKEYYWFEELLYQLRIKCKNTLYQVFQEESADVYAAMLFGDKGELGVEAKAAYQMAGITHILSISGLHISLIGLAIYEILKRMGVKITYATLICTFLIFSYVVLTGNHPSTMRAFLMFMLLINGKLMKRSYDMLSGISASGIFLLLSNPYCLYDIGCILSYTAVLSMALIFPIFREGLENFSISKSKCFQSLVANLSIWILTLPIILYAFYEIPTYSLLANLLILPTMSCVVISGFGATFLGMLILNLGKIVAIPGTWILFFYEVIGKGISKLPLATVVIGRPHWSQIVGYYLGILVFLLCSKSEKFRKGAYLSFVVSLLIIFFKIPHQTTITNLDVGQGECGLIQTKSGETYIIDGGSSTSKEVGKFTIIPFLKHEGIQCVNGIFLSHPDIDHMNGITQLLELVASNLVSIKVNYLYLPTWMEDTKEGKELSRLAKKAKSRVVYVKEGDYIKGKSYKLRVLHPENDPSEDYENTNKNAGSMVLLYEEKDFKGLFTGDIEMEQEERIYKKIGACDYLKVSHHGSKTGSSPKFLEGIKPLISVVSCKKNNRYGHPHKEVVQRLEKNSKRVTYTMNQGGVTITIEKGGLSLDHN